MTTIKASCPCCGDVELSPEQVRLVVCTVTDWSYYAFMCHSCTDEIRKPAGRDVISLLRTGGVPIEHWAIPAEALEDHQGAAVSYDDVLDFALRLEQTDNLMAALTSLRPGQRIAS